MGRVNPWLLKAIGEAERARRQVRGFHAIVQVDPARQEEVKAGLRRIRGVEVLDQVPGWIRVDVEEPALLDAMARLPGVIMVHPEKPVWPMALGIDEAFKALGIRRDPILSKLNRGQLEALGFRFKPALVAPDPMAVLLTPKLLPVPIRGGIEWRTVAYTRRIIEAPKDYSLTARTKVAVIDTGANPHPALRKRFEQVVLVPEPPMDTMGHGMWCTTCAFGDAAPSRFGLHVPVARAASGSLLHVKIFTAFGPTSSWHVIKSMYLAAEWGARVVSMSLGGVLAGRVDEDPECIAVRQLSERYGTLFIIAAGNEGPDPWTVASPGASPYALTVAAMDWKTMDVSSYSSRGPQGAWYKDRRAEFEEDLAKYGDALLKPDVAAPGGDRRSQIVSGVTGWYDGIYDFIPDGFEVMIGTSMATPHAAGLVALAYDRGLIRTMGGLKGKLRRPEKDRAWGWGLIKWPSLR